MSDIYEIINSQREFFKTEKTKDISFRKKLLINLRNMINENETLILQALHTDLGKSYEESYLTEIGMVMQEINYTLRHLKLWTNDKTVPTPFYHFPAISKKVKHPYGLTLIFSPWNYPFNLSIIPLISSIASGNCTILKPSEHSPATTELLCKLIDRYFDREYIAVVKDSFEAVQAIQREHFDLIFYTGGALVAKIVLKAAAAQLTPVILELGGKSPCIVDKSANLKLAARRIVFGKLVNAGQTCVAPDYLFVESSIREKLVEYIKYYADKFYTICPCQNKYYPKIINKRHYGRLKAYLSDGDIILGGEYSDSEQKISLTLIENLKKDSKLLSEEIFGPILPLYEFHDINIVINYISKRERSLALYLFASDKKIIKSVISSLSFGGGCVNDTIMHLSNPNLPFGGVGASGMGRYHGKAGFNTFSSEASIMVSPSHGDFNPLRYPPFGDNYLFIKYIMKYFT